MKMLKLDELDELVSRAGDALFSAVAILKDLKQDAALLLPDDSSDDKAKVLQLILQYRLDTQDALIKLVHLNNNLLKVLGVGPEYSREMNLDRISYAVGNEDLHQILYALGHVVESLLRVADRYRQEQQKVSAKKRYAYTLNANPQNTKILRYLQKANAQQKLFLSLIPQISLQLEGYIKTEAIDPVFDHIAALRGPISQFFQAEQNGLEVAHNLYDKVNEEIQLENNIAYTLEQANLALKKLPTLYQPHPTMTPVMNNRERLEQRAAEKRTRNFFPSPYIK